MLHLLPRPQRLMPLEGVCKAGEVRSAIDPQTIDKPQGYQLTLDQAGIQIVAHDAAGEFYARQTLAQIRAQCPLDQLPCLRITDWPDIPARGVMLDISRDKVPTMATLFQIVDMLASWKVNQLQLYTEHTFAYSKHKVVWKDASPMTADEVRELDAYCKARFVELVPNQNSFGHLARWFMHPQYLPLAETDRGIDHAYTQGVDAPFSLCPTDPKAIDFLGGLYDELLPNFSSNLFNVGCDETFDIGMGRSAEAVKQRGKGAIYVEFLKKLNELCKQRGKRMMFWADIVHEHPEVIDQVPKDAIALEWGYWEYHEFQTRCRRLKNAGLDFYVCPGTSTWLSFVGNNRNAINNLRSASHLGFRAGAIGYLNTDWGDNGHHQPLPTSYVGYAAGAAMGWSYFMNQTIDLPAVLDLFAFRDRSGTMGKLAYDLGDSYLYCDGVPYAWMIFAAHEPKSSRRFMRMNLEAIIKLQDHVRETMKPLAQSRMQIPDGQLVADEFKLASSLVLHCCKLATARWSHEGEHVVDLPGNVRRELADDLRPLIAEHERVWLARNRPGGLVDSAERLRRVMRLYETK